MTRPEQWARSLAASLESLRWKLKHCHLLGVPAIDVCVLNHMLKF